MNDTRRKDIREIITRLEELESEIEDIRNSIEEIQEEEEEYRDNIPENLQQSERYTQSEQSSNNLSGAIDSVDEISSAITDVYEYLQSAIE